MISFVTRHASRVTVFNVYVFVVFLLNVFPIYGFHTSVGHNYIIHIRLDYWIHAVMFLPWMALTLFGFPGCSLDSGKPLLRKTMLLLSGILFAIFCESIQYFIAWRTFNINDLAANLLGVMVGLPVIFFLPERGDEKRSDR
jgi:VanZ family protein